MRNIFINTLSVFIVLSTLLSNTISSYAEGGGGRGPDGGGGRGPEGGGGRGPDGGGGRGPQNIKNGENIFAANCSACHAGGNNVIINEKNLRKNILHDNGMDSPGAITYQVTNGKNAMPAFGGRLSDSDIEDVADFVLAQSEKGWDVE